MEPIAEENDEIVLSSSCTHGVDTNYSYRKVLQGVLCFKSVRANFASFHLAIPSANNEEEEDDDDEDLMILLVQFQDNHLWLRSYCRRFYKLGDLISIWEPQDLQQESFSWKGSNKLALNLDSAHQITKAIAIQQVRFWSIRQCQQRQRQSEFGTVVRSTTTQRNQNRKNHGKNLDKRIQGELVANFLVHMIMSMHGCIMESSSWTDDPRRNPGFSKAVEYLNRGSGVIDVAGGSGHVSMGFGRLGIQSTIVDPRESVGKLPGRDRKVWNRLLRTSNGNSESLCCHPVVPFNVMRAWFGSPPDGVDVSYRHEDQQSMPVCGLEHDLINRCTAIVALHPDEATDAAVDTALAVNVPFVVIPCCVFYRLFSHRRLPGNVNGRVSTHQDLIAFLAAKHESIQLSKLPFDGANTVLFSTCKTTHKE